MNKFISSKSAKVAAVAMGLVAGFAMSASIASAYTFNTNLKVGSTGVDVLNLQQVLNMSADTAIAGTGAGSPGHETSYFGPITKAAVIRFQEKYASDILAPVGLTAGTGFVGASTRAHLNATTPSTTGMVTGCTSLVGFSPTTGQSCATGAVTTSIPAGCTSTVGFSSTTGASCSTGASTVVTSGPVSVSLANDNPAASAVVAGQATADLAHFAFSGNGTLTNIKLLRTGISSNSTLTNVYLYNGNIRVSDGASVNNTDSTITFNNLNLAVNGSLTLSVRADILTGTAGQIIGVQLIGYTTSGNAASTASISGNFMNIAGATLASVTASSTSVATASINAGTMSQTFWTGAVNVSTRAVALKGASFKFIGSAPTDAIANLRIYVNGSPVGSAATVDANNHLSFDFGSSPVTLNTGSQTVELRGDIMKGSNRTAQFNLENAGDLMVMDSQLNVNVAVTAPSTSGFAIQSGTTVTILTGSVTTAVDPTFTSVTNVTGGATGATIGKFKLTAYGEDVKVTSLAVTPAFSTAPTPAANGLNNVSLFYNGSQIGSSQNMTGTTTALTFQLGSALIIAAGTTGTLEVRADIQSAASVNYTAGTITASLVAGSSNGQGQSSSATMAVPTGTITTTGLTVSTGALSVSKAAGYTDQVVNPNTPNVKIGSYVIQNTSTSESVRISNLAVGITGSSTVTNLGNLRTSVTTNSVSPTASNNFSVSLVLAPGQTQTIDITADLNSVNAGETVITSLLPTAIGASSNVTVTPGSASTGQTITVQTGSLAVPTLVTSGSSVAQFVAAGGTNGAVDGSKAQFNFVASNGTATITDLKFAVASSTGTPISSIRVGTVSAPIVAGVASLSGLSISIPTGAAGTNVDVYATYSQVGNNAASSSATSTVSLTYMKYTIGGTTTSTSTLSIAAPSMTSVGSKPTVTVATPAGAILAGSSSVEAIDVTITADAAGPLTLNSFPITSSLSPASGSAFTAFTSSNVTVKDGNNNPVTTTNTVTTAAATATSTISFTGGYQLAAGQSQTFKVFLPVDTLGGSGTIPNTYMYTSVATGSGFSWSDTAGNSTAPITGTTLFVNYPSTTTSSVHN